jgi:outer membrane protein TolC
MRVALTFLLGLFAVAGHSVTFDEAVGTALEQSYDVLRSKIDVLSAKADRLKSISLMSPTGLFTFGDQTYSQPITGQGAIFQSSHARQAQVTIGVDLERILENLVRAWAQGGQIALTNAQMELATIETAFGVAQIYRLAQQAAMKVDVSKSALETARKQQKDAEALYSYGKISKSDKLEIDVSFNNATLALATAENDLLKAHTPLRKFMGITTDGPLELDALKDLNANTVLEIPSPTEAVSQAMRSRVDLDLSRQIESLRYTGSLLTLAPYLPRVAVNVNWQWNFGEQLSVFTLPFVNYATINLTWNFWDGGATLFEYRKAHLQARRASVDFREKTFDVRSDAEQSVRDMELAKETLKLRDVGLQKAQEAYRGFEARFKLGALSVTDLLFAENTLNQAKLDHLSATVGLDIAYMKMQKALGKKRPVPL